MDISLCSVVFVFYAVDCFMCCGILILFCSLFFYNAAHRLISSFSGVLFMFYSCFIHVRCFLSIYICRGLFIICGSFIFRFDTYCIILCNRITYLYSVELSLFSVGASLYWVENYYFYILGRLFFIWCGLTVNCFLVYMKFINMELKED